VNGDSFELAQVQTVAQKLKGYSNTFTDNEIQSFLQLANKQEEPEVGRGATLPERVLAVLESLEANLEASLSALEVNEIDASWELAGWVSMSEAEIATLKVEYERKQVYADRLAT
jgi:hypothetical protein